MISSACLESWDEEDIRDCGATSVIGKLASYHMLLEEIAALLELRHKETPTPKDCSIAEAL